jgi:hypothetical protein
MTTGTNWRWIWFFVLLAVLATSGVAYEVWYNLHQQLKPQNVAAARRLWDEEGPRDYVLNYQVKWEYNPEPATSEPDRYTVVVHGGKVKSVTPEEGGPLPSKEHVLGTMAELFDFIDEQMRADTEPGQPRAFVKATFDPNDGHVVHYVHSVMRTRERLEISVRLDRVKP